MKLNRISPSYPTTSATLLIGQNRGKLPVNAKGYCKALPRKLSKSDVDETVRLLRVGDIAKRAVATAPTAAAAKRAQAKARQAAERAFAASRVSQKGWYQGAPESSVAFTFHHDPDVPGEATPELFRFHMSQLAEEVSAVLCQDSVIVTFDTPGEKGTRFVDTNDASDAAIRAEAQRRLSRRR